jgi:hypothetical protein
MADIALFSELLFQSRDHADITIKTQTFSTRVHKFMLLKIPFFQNSLQNNNISLLEIMNVDYEVLNEVLRYAYYNQVENLKDNALKLLLAADKFDYGDLFVLSKEFLKQNITNENYALVFLETNGLKNDTNDLQQAIVYFASE